MQSKNDFCVYAHYRKSDDKLFYIGKGREYRHSSKNGRNNWWNKIANKHGWYWKKVYVNLTEDCAFSIEKMLIHIYKKDICNITIGGEGVSGVKLSEEHKQKLRESATGRPGFWLGKKRDEATKAKMPKYLPGKDHPHFGKFGAEHPRFGYTITPKHKAAISASVKGIPLKPETCEKISKAKTGSGHHMYDKKIYIFLNEDGRKYEGTQYDFRNLFGFRQNQSWRLVNGKSKNLMGWRCAWLIEIEA